MAIDGRDLRQVPTHDSSMRALALGLGAFSLALGAAEALAPRKMARLIGVRDTRRATSTLRTFGVREIANGVALLAQPDRSRWLWARAGGDLLDLSYLAGALRNPDNHRGRLVAAAAVVLAVSAVDAMSADRVGPTKDAQTEREGASHSPKRSDVCVATVRRPIDQVYALWRDFSNFPRFMRHLDALDLIGDGRSRWRVKGPAGMTVEWEAELVTDRENECIAWRSIEGAAVENSGSVTFSPAPADRGTEVRVTMLHHVPGGSVGRGLAWLFGATPEQQIREDLRRFKQMVEIGEIVRSDGSGLSGPARPTAPSEQNPALEGASA